MACCGQRREQLKTPINREGTTQTANWISPQPRKAAAPPSSVKLRYLASARIRVTGSTTGRQYEFSGAAALQNVDARDAEALVRSKFFRRETGA